MILLTHLAIGLFSLLLTASTCVADVSIAYQTGIDPAKLAIADDDYAVATGAKINWRKFDNGAEVIRAMASGDIDIGNVGSSVLATAASRRLPIEAFLVATELGGSEALVVRHAAGINNPQGLIGKTIAVPFVSTAHYSLLSALLHWGVDAKKVKIINLRVAEISAAWQRGDIDAAYVWEPGLGRIKETGTVLTTSAELAQWGAPTFDLWVVRRAFAEQNPEFLRKFVAVTLAEYEKFKANPAAFSTNQDTLQKIARVSGAKLADIQTLLNSDTYPVKAAQSPLLVAGGTVAKALTDTASFLKGQGQLDQVLPDYNAYVSSRYLQPTSP
jgi:taurine transport system substrate-binding protein